MSKNSVAYSKPNALFINRDLSKIFIRNPRSEQGTFSYENSSYSDATVVAGTVLGRIAATNTLVILDPSATDGSQYPVGVLMQDVAVAAGDTYEDTVTMCVSGDVAQEQLAFADGVDLDTVVEHRTVRDRIGADTVGVKLIPTSDQTFYDNQ